MKIKTAKTPSLFAGLRLRFRANWKGFFFGLATVNLIGVLGVALVAVKYERQFDIALMRVSDVFVGLSDYPEATINYLLALPTSAEKLHIDIKHIDVQSLEYQRTRALNESEKDFEYVPATIRVGPGPSTKVKIRPKGDRRIHFDQFDKTSYRVRVKGDNTIFGMKTFSLQKPRVRNHIHEWIFLDMMKRSGLIAPRYKFIRLTRNGKDLGIFVMEEHYDKHLIESNQRRDGPIIRFDENTSLDYKVAVIAPFRSKTWKRPDKLPLTRKAVQLLEAFRRGDLTASEVFDVDQLAAFFAITDMTDTHHGAITKSLRFYYNPITSKLEPVPFDGHYLNAKREDIARFYGYDVMIAGGYGLTGKEEHWINSEYGGWFRHLFNNADTVDRDFVSKYMATLERLTKSGHLEEYFSEIEDSLSDNLNVIYQGFPLFDNVFSFGPGPFVFRDQHYYGRRDRIRSMMEDATVSAHLISRDGRDIALEVKSTDPRFPMEILSLTCMNRIALPAAETAVLIEEGSALLEPSVHRVLVKLPEGTIDGWQDASCYRLNFRILGTSTVKTTEVTPWKEYEPKAVIGDVTRSSGNLEHFEFINIDEQGKRAIVEPGVHVINRNLVVPAGYLLVVKGGTEFILNDGAMIFSHAPVQMIGVPSDPVIITSKDGSGQGLTVMSAGAESHVEYVQIHGMTNPSQNDWSLTGMVNFYESPVKIRNVQIFDNRSEDALNIIRGEFDMEGLNIRNATSDALDVDFGAGKIRSSVFERNGNDAIDVSGTVIDLENVRIDGAGDKGLSAGEDSRMTGREVFVGGAEVAVASKDSSEVRLEGLDISGAAVGLTAYKKKPEFGPASINISSLTQEDVGVLQLIEVGSDLTVDSQFYAGNVEKIEDMMYGAIYGKKSR